MKGQIKYNKVNNGYHVTIKIDGGNKKTEFPFEGKIFRTKRAARVAIASAYREKCWNLNMDRNTITVEE